MAPIRVGIIGLSKTSFWAVAAHLPYLKSTSKYTITGICNSSLESSKAAVEAYELSGTAKAYGSVAEMAASSDVDLVVCAVRVDRHYETIKPALEAGKDCFVEWPLASNLEQATELLQLAEKKGVKTMIGLQTQMSPAIARIREIIDTEQTLGRIVSSNVIMAGMLGGSSTIEPMEYLNHGELGGSMLSIPFAHFYDAVSLVLGELQDLSATVSVQYPEVPVRTADGAKVLRTTKRTAADQVATSGLLASGTQSSAIVYGGTPFKGEPTVIWRVEGTKGVLDFRQDDAFAIAFSGTFKIRVQLHGSSEVEEIEIKEDRPGPPGNIGRLYDAFADGEYHPDWKWAVKRHAWLDAIEKSNESGKRVSYV